MRKAALHNLGCKVNAYESEAMQELLEENGYEIVPFGESADVYVINTCTVTNMADRKSRQMIHKARKLNPDAAVVAAGCYVQTRGGEADDGIDIMIGNNRKKDLILILEEYFQQQDVKKQGTLLEAGRVKSGSGTAGNVGRREVYEALADIGKSCGYEELSLSRQAEHTRAIVKVQDGCNQFCSYCIIPYARGRVRSRRQEDILQEVRGLAGNGFREIVLTGIHVSSYGLDFDQRKNPAKGEAFPHERLLNLLRELDHITGIARIRLSSLEPRIITPEFVAGLKEIRKLCHHFHLSLQSGCDETLLRMNRHYTTGEYLEKVELLREAFDHPAVTTDVIVGFPGESEEEFEKTKRFLENVNFYEMHVFPYSRREGTAAAERRDQIPEAVKKKRSGILLELVKKQSKAFREDYIGRNVEVLFEESKEINGVSCQIGYTGEYIRAAKKTAEDISGKIYAGRLSGFTKDNKLSDNSPSDNLLWFE